MFESYFVNLQDIGKTEVILTLAENVGLDSKELEMILQENRNEPDVDKAIELAHSYGFRGVPMYLINDTYNIFGAQSLDYFRERLQSISEENIK